jgi:hypothetical protein
MTSPRLGAVVIAALVLSSCSSSGDVKTEQPEPVATSVVSSPSPTGIDETAAILAAYREFFARQAEISMAAKGERQALLAPFTTDPALQRVLRGMLAAEEIGEVGYGQPVVNPVVHSIDGDVATVYDCQDGSQAGRKNKATGKVVSRGAKKSKAVVTLHRGDDDRWRVATIAFPDEPCDD